MAQANLIRQGKLDLDARLWWCARCGVQGEPPCWYCGSSTYLTKHEPMGGSVDG
jgi:hypothetical protein